MKKCLLCASNNLDVLKYSKKNYFECLDCGFVFFNTERRINVEEEILRYHTHEIKLDDAGSVNFVKKILDYGLNYITGSKILDYGCGNAFITQYILKNSNFCIDSYDPVFNNISLDQKYDLIVCSEVVEHFRDPTLEFKKLFELLNDSGVLAISTSIFSKSINFDTWYYVNDDTHFSIYSKSTIDYICKNFGFELCLLKEPRFIILKKSIF